MDIVCLQKENMETISKCGQRKFQLSLDLRPTQPRLSPAKF